MRRRRRALLSSQIWAGFGQIQGDIHQIRIAFDPLRTRLDQRFRLKLGGAQPHLVRVDHVCVRLGSTEFGLGSAEACVAFS